MISTLGHVSDAKLGRGLNTQNSADCQHCADKRRSQPAWPPKGYQEVGVELQGTPS